MTVIYGTDSHADFHCIGAYFLNQFNNLFMKQMNHIPSRSNLGSLDVSCQFSSNLSHVAAIHSILSVSPSSDSCIDHPVQIRFTSPESLIMFRCFHAVRGTHLHVFNQHPIWSIFSLWVGIFAPDSAAVV